MPLVMPASHRQALSAFAERLRADFGGRLHLLRLFGSWARGDASVGSDLDVAVVVDDLDREQWRRIIDISADLEVAHGVDLGPYVVSTAHWTELNDRGRALAAAISREGIAL